MTLRVYIIAGEPSGDLLGSRLMRAVKVETRGKVQFMGVGGETMQAEGLKSLFNIRDLAVMGLMEVLPSIPKILHHLDEIITDIECKKPDIVLTIDSYSFSIRVHKKLKKLNLGIPHVHCVAPQVWAWKQGRAKILPKYIDHLFCLLPNEEKYFKPHGLQTTFIGHPVVEGGADKGSARKFRQSLHLTPKKKVLLLLSGSRRNEIQSLLPIFMQAAEIFVQKNPHFFVVVPTVHTVQKEVTGKLKNWSVPHAIIVGEKERYDAFAAADLAIAASGTVSLELALARVPHLIAYRVHPITGALAKKLLKIRFVNLINLLQNKMVIPELLQENCTPKKIVQTIQKLFKTPRQDVLPSLKKLGMGTSPSHKMAKVLIRLARGRND